MTRPTPTHLRIVKGNPGKRAYNKREPQPKRERPSCPAHLSDKARETWGFVVSRLDEMGVLTRADALAVEMLCEAVGDYRTAREDLREFGSNYYETVNQTGGKMYRAHPALATVQDADRRLKAWFSEFGLTPSARTRVQGTPPEDDDPLAAYFDGGRK
jgi:P27 family predicted phage terminase small subunit